MTEKSKKPKATENKAKDVEIDKQKELLVNFAKLQLQREQIVRQAQIVDQQMANIRNQLAGIKNR